MAFRGILCPFKKPSFFSPGPRVENKHVLPTLGVPLTPRILFCFFVCLSSAGASEPYTCKISSIQVLMDWVGFQKSAGRYHCSRTVQHFHRCCVLKRCLFPSSLAYSSKQSCSTQFNARKKKFLFITFALMSNR